MRIKNLSCLGILLFFFQSGLSQYDGLDTLGFISPVDHEMKLTGNFGELRKNHFHSGIDIKSKNGRSGDPLLCVHDGWVSRIKVQLSGYGQALYIDHPNGYTSVYAHIDHFAPKIDSFLKSRQYFLQSYLVDLYLDPAALEFSKGDTIAFMGNTGRSTGPHLHFELRDTKSEEPINPFHFGLNVQDNIDPVINKIICYGLDKNHIPINKSSIPNKKNNTIYIDAWRAAVGVNVHDFMNGAWNKNGIYKVELLVNDSLYFHVNFDQFAFDETRYINACIDYEHKMTIGNRHLLLYKQPGNNLKMYNKSTKLGVIKLYKDLATAVRINIVDFEGNEISRSFKLKRKSDISALIGKKYDAYLKYNEAHQIKREHLSVDFPLGSFYRDMFFNIKGTEKGFDLNQNNLFKIGDKTEACHKFYKMSLDVSTIPDSIRKQLCVIYLDEGSPKSIGGRIENNQLIAFTNRMGRFKIAMDDIAPSLNALNLSGKLTNNHVVKIQMNDNFSTLGFARDPSWNVFIDGVWVLSSYDLKSNLISFRVPKTFSKGNHHMMIMARDDRGNESQINKAFILE